MKENPLLLIHGYPFDHTLWYSTIASLGSKAKVVAPDLPGFGAEFTPRDIEPSMDAYAEFLRRHLDANRHEKVVVCGMSMGGYVALAFAEMFPDRVRGLGLISTQAAADTPETRQSRKDMIEKIREKGSSAAGEAILPKMFSDNRPSDPALTKYVVEGVERAGRDGLSWALQAMAARPDRMKLLSNLKVPVLVLHGSEDKIVPIERAHSMAERCQKPIFVEARGAGHATPLEAPDSVANALVRLLKACKESLPRE